MGTDEASSTTTPSVSGRRTSLPRTSYRATPSESDAEWGAWGYRNAWGGFHRTTDPYAYLGLLRLVLLNLHRPKVARYPLHLMRDRWRHRRCDTVDFHHSVYCTLDAYGKRLDDQYRWQRAWTGK